MAARVTPLVTHPVASTGVARRLPSRKNHLASDLGTTAEYVQPSALNVAERGVIRLGFPPIGNKEPAPKRPRNVSFTSSAARIWIVERIVKEDQWPSGMRKAS